MAIKLSPIAENMTLKDRVYDRLRASIVEMNIYDEGANLRLDERSMAEQLQVSRTPLREALTRLENDGFIEIRPRKGVFVVRKTMGEILEMIVAWAALESMAARLACAEASDHEIAELRRIGTQYTKDKAKANISEYSEANIDFHLHILGMSKCAMLQEIAEGLFTHLKAVRRKGMEDTRRADRSVVDHMNIIEAIEDRDAELADQLVREHTMRLHDYLRRSWKHIIGPEQV